MSVYTFANKDFLETELLNGSLSDTSINNSNLDLLQTSNSLWQKTDITDSNCNNSVFNSTQFTNCSFFRSNMMNSQFINCSFMNTKFSGICLIKIQFDNSRLEKQLFDSCTMQRALLNKLIVQNSTFKDFEAVYARINNSVFINCFFELNYGSGSNGFSGAELKNCIFLNCSFSGYPMRGSKLKGCTFIGCSGEITDDIEAESVFGLQNYNCTDETTLINRNRAVCLINEVQNV